MRILFPALSLFIAVFSIMVDVARPPSEGALCSLGLCRFDQLFSSIDARGIQTRNIEGLLNEDPSNPLVWCTYGEFLAAHGDVEKAKTIFARAITLGPGMAPVLMRVANFDFSRGQTGHGLEMARRILSQTNAFDEVLFSYLLHSGLAAQELLESAIPTEARPARAWLVWASNHGPVSDTPTIWRWMIHNHLLDSKTAIDVSQILWKREAFDLSRQVWLARLSASLVDDSDPERLWNPGFRNEPDGSPFDWTLSTSSGDVSMGDIARIDGLEIHFAGDENADLDAHQFTTIGKGRYRFSAEISTEGLTAGEECPVFHIFDSSSNGRLDVRSSPMEGTIGRSWVNLDFEAPSDTQTLEVRLERRAPKSYGNRIRGTLHIYQVSLVRVRK